MSISKQEELLIHELVRVFEAWVKSDRSKKFTSGFFLELASLEIKENFSSKIKKESGFWALCLRRAKINPDCFSKVRFSPEENKKRLIESVREIKEVLGVEKLNDNNMNQARTYIPLPKALTSERGDFSLSEKHGIEPTISLAAFQRRCVSAFGSWDKSLELAGIEVEQVKRKVGAHSIEGLLFWFDNFARSRNGSWTVTTIRDEDHALFRAIGNNLSRRASENIMPTQELSEEYIYNFWVLWRFWTEQGSTDFDLGWYADNQEALKLEYEINHRAQERWSLERIQEEALSLYAGGSNFTRDEIVATASGKRLLSAMRRKNYSATGGEASTLSRVGILVDRLRDLDSIIRDVPLEFVLGALRGLVKESLAKGENLLSREKMERRNPEVFSAALRWQSRLSGDEGSRNDWAKTLSFFGLNPGVFELSASKRGRRGSAFQRFFEEVIREKFIEVDSPEKLEDKRQVCFNKSYSSDTCSHKIRCKPDFVFKECIIDTKVGGALAKAEQLDRYLDHCSNLYIITINDKKKKFYLENGAVEILGFSDFLSRSNEILGVTFDGDLEKRLSEVLRVSSAFSPDG